MIGTSALKDVFGPGTHGSTFGGNPVSLAAAQTVLTEMTPPFLSEVREKGLYLKEQLEHTIGTLEKVREIRGIGLMIGIEVTNDSSAIIQHAIQQGLLVLTAGPNVIRLLPPLTITYEEIDQITHMLKQSIQEC